MNTLICIHFVIIIVCIMYINNTVGHLLLCLYHSSQISTMVDQYGFYDFTPLKYVFPLQYIITQYTLTII